MPAPRRVPDAFYHASLWLGAGLGVILFGAGFAERAGDHSPWTLWTLAPAALLPFALLVWLRDTGKITLIDTEAVEEDLYEVPVPARLRRRWYLPLYILATIAGTVWDEYLEDRVADRGASFLSGLPHLEYGAWVLIGVGIAGLVYETIAVVRGAPRTPAEPTPPGTEGRPGA